MLIAAWIVPGRVGAEAEPSTEAATLEDGAASPPDSEPDAHPPSEQEPSPAPQGELTPEEQHRLDVLSEQATLHWQEGKLLYEKGRYAEAAAEFERSYAAVAAAETLYGVALSYERAGKAVEAVRALQRYLALPDCSDDPGTTSLVCTKSRPAAEQALAEQRRWVGELVLSLGDGVELRMVKVDGRPVPLDDFPLVLAPGMVDVEVFGGRPSERRSRSATITGGEVTTFYVAPFEAEPGRGTVPRPAVPGPVDDAFERASQQRRQRQLETALWVGVGLTGSTATAMAITGSIALHHKRRFEAELCETPCTRLDADGNPVPKGGPDEDLYPHDHEAKLVRYRAVTNALVGVTVGLGVATALVGSFVLRGRIHERARAHERGAPARAGRPRVRLGGSGLLVRW